MSLTEPAEILLRGKEKLGATFPTITERDMRASYDLRWECAFGRLIKEVSLRRFPDWDL